MMSHYSQSYLADPRNAAEVAQLRATHLSLGTHPEFGDEFLVSNVNRESGMYVIGTQGKGKSSLLKSLIHQDIEAGNAVFVLDPHLDLTHESIAEMVNRRVRDTYVFDITDEAYPFGINLFSVGELTSQQDWEQAVERVLHVFHVLWPKAAEQQYLPNYLNASAITLLSNPGSTLVDMLRLLEEPDYRTQLLQRVTDPLVLNFWHKHDALGKGGDTRTAPLTGRLNALFMGRSIMRNVVGQRKTTINFRQAIEARQVVFIKLPVNAMAQNAYLLGTMIVGQLSAALFSYADVPREKRPGVSIYIDEFQNFTTPDFSKIFTEGRKYGARLVVAHQYRKQLPDYLRDSTLTARTIVCMGVTTDDAPELAKQFPAQTDGAFEPSMRATKELLSRTSDFPAPVREFVDVYLRRLPKGNSDIEFKVSAGLGGILTGNNDPIKVKRANPLSYLDTLFYEVMQSGNPQLPIPEEAVYGLAHGGEGFHSAINFFTSTHILSLDIPEFPAHLVQHHLDGSISWGRKRTTEGREQLWHCLFHLRLVMHYLAANPIGKQTAAKSSNVAEMLVQLPPRIAFVKSDKSIGVILTHNTPKPLTGADLEGRMTFIREQTRQRYCQPKAVVEAALRSHASYTSAQPQHVPADAIQQPQPVPAPGAASPVSMPLRRQWQEVDKP